MQYITNLLQAVFPASFDTYAYVRFVAILILGSLVVGLIARFAFGKRSSLNHSVSSAIGILFMYAISVVISAFCTPLAAFLSPLPFVEVSGDSLSVFPILNSNFPAICSQLLGMVVLSFIINLLDSYLPNAKRFFGWLFRNIAVIALGFVCHGLVFYLFSAFAPQVLQDWAPVVLLCILAFLLLLSILKALLGVALTAVNPVIAAIYAFFFANKIGKLLTKALLTAILLVLIVVALNWVGCTVICVSTAVLSAYIPLLVILIVLWFVIGKLL